MSAAAAPNTAVSLQSVFEGTLRWQTSRRSTLYWNGEAVQAMWPKPHLARHQR